MFQLRPTPGSSHTRSGWEEQSFSRRGNSRCENPDAEKRLTGKELKATRSTSWAVARTEVGDMGRAGLFCVLHTKGKLGFIVNTSGRDVSKAIIQ